MSTDDQTVAVADAVDAYLERKAVGDPDGNGAGTYASNAKSILHRWVEWLESTQHCPSLVALEVDHMQAYAIELHTRADNGKYTASTARTYYAVVRAFLSWCVRGGLRESNPAATDAAESALPTDEVDSDSEFWSATQRRQLVRTIRDRALEAPTGADNRDERRNRLREYALVALLAHSGVRGSELFRVPDDERRTGATWDDVDFYTGLIRVLGKSQRLEEVPLPAAARTPLRRYRVVLDPPSNDWPLFPTRHAPSIASRVRTVLGERGYTDAAVEDEFAEATATQLAREHAIAPPAITTEGARSVLKRLCDTANIDIDGDYLTPRGVRVNGEGTQIRRDATTAKSTLRAAVFEQTIAVPETPPPIIDIDSSEQDDYRPD